MYHGIAVRMYWMTCMPYVWTCHLLHLGCGPAIVIQACHAASRPDPCISATFYLVKLMVSPDFMDQLLTLRSGYKVLHAFTCACLLASLCVDHLLANVSIHRHLPRIALFDCCYCVVPALFDLA